MWSMPLASKIIKYLFLISQKKEEYGKYWTLIRLDLENVAFNNILG